jgi:N6-adenosine-specific RNA methylase IME4
MTFPDGKFKVIYADPPWHFKVHSEKGEGRSAKNHYNVMSLEDIKALPVRDLAAENCALLMWATDPLLDKAFEVINAWGFTFKTVGFYWVKLRKPYRMLDPFTNCFAGDKLPLLDDNHFAMGTGYYTRANPEQCLLATVGSPWRFNKDVRRLVVSPRRDHSQKPDEMYDRIERLFPGPYIELFARQTRPGWVSWGNETEKYGVGEP